MAKNRLGERVFKRILQITDRMPCSHQIAFFFFLLKDLVVGGSFGGGGWGWERRGEGVHTRCQMAQHMTDDKLHLQLSRIVICRMPNGVHSILDTDHSRIRGLLANAFSEKALHEQKPIMQKYVDLLIASLRARARAGESIDISDWLNFTTFDIIGVIQLLAIRSLSSLGDYFVRFFF